MKTFAHWSAVLKIKPVWQISWPLLGGGKPVFKLVFRPFIYCKFNHKNLRTKSYFPVQSLFGNISFEFRQSLVTFCPTLPGWGKLKLGEDHLLHRHHHHLEVKLHDRQYISPFVAYIINIYVEHEVFICFKCIYLAFSTGLLSGG
jgi:hypothetical protein